MMVVDGTQFHKQIPYRCFRKEGRNAACLHPSKAGSLTLLNDYVMIKIYIKPKIKYTSIDCALLASDTEELQSS